MRLKLLILIMLFSCTGYGQSVVPIGGSPLNTVRTLGKHQIDSLLRVMTLKNLNGDAYMITTDTGGKFILRPVPSSGSGFDSTYLYGTVLPGKQDTGTYLIPSDTANHWLPIGYPLPTDYTPRLFLGVGSGIGTTYIDVDTALASGYWVRRKDSTLIFVTPAQLEAAIAGIATSTLQQVGTAGNSYTGAIQATRFDIDNGGSVHRHVSLATTTRIATDPDATGTYLYEDNAAPVSYKVLDMSTNTMTNVATGSSTDSFAVVKNNVLKKVAPPSGAIVVNKSGVVNGLATGSTTIFTTEAGRGDFVITQVIATTTALTGTLTSTLTAFIVHSAINVGSFSATAAQANAVGRKQVGNVNSGVINVPPSTAVSVNVVAAHTVATVVSYRVDILGYYTN